jgi:hypothetical protein
MRRVGSALRRIGALPGVRQAFAWTGCELALIALLLAGANATVLPDSIRAVLMALAACRLWRAPRRGERSLRDEAAGHKKTRPRG